MQARIQEHPAFVVVGARHQGGVQGGEIPALWNQWNPVFATLPSSPAGIAYGLTLDFQGATMTIDYLAGVPMAADAATPEGLFRLEVPAQTYAVFDCTLATLSQTIMASYSEWLPQSGYQRGPGPEFEHYDAAFDTPEQLLTFWLPIQAQ
jgi:AraC family transcriptional regulator